MKKCSCCQKIKPDDSFNFKNRAKFKRNSFCADCHKAYCKTHYAKNKKYYKQKARKWDTTHIKKNRKKLIEHLHIHFCVDCGERDPVVLEFDHVRGKKTKDISSLISQPWPWSRVLVEIAKCEVRCANCHRRRTAKQCGWFLKKSARSSAG